MKRKLFQFIFTVIFIVVDLASIAQPYVGPSGPGINPGPPVPVEGVPFGGIELILAAGVAFGAYSVLREPRRR